MKKSLFRLFLALFAILITNQSIAVTNGELDGDEHPQVVLILMEIGGQPASRCSGVLIEDRYVLTAGHCTNNYPGWAYTGMRIFTESDIDNGDNNYPWPGNNSVEAVRWAAHPDYETAPFFHNDVGMIELAEPVALSEYADLPIEANYLDRYAKKRGRNKLYFTAVGYGLQRINPVFVEAERVRMSATPKLIQINTPGFTGDFSLLLSNNHSTGGTCFGDSGGPNFIHDSLVVGGVTSFGLNGNCAGTGGVFRIDRQNVLDFINGFILAGS